MQESAKNTPPRPKAEQDGRNHLVKDAQRWVKDGGSVAAFARLHDIARSTLRGRLNGHNQPRGRQRKLGPFEETEILRLLLKDARIQDWKTVQETVRRQSGESISRRSVFRLLRKWGFVSPTAVPGKTTSVVAIPWAQPQETLHPGSNALEVMLWKIQSGRGTEGFILTSGESTAELERVVTAISARLKMRKKSMLTNHEQLARLLKIALPRWDVRCEK